MQSPHTKNQTSFRLNGQSVSVSDPASRPLLFVLRETLNAKGTRFGCGEATCGACTVIVDGKAATSCDLPLSAVAGKSVQTVEGLSAADALHPLAEAVVDLQAAQCGYCLPGILMAAKALLDRDPRASDACIREALDANLCRCGAHGRILKAIRLAGDTIIARGDRS